MTQGHKENCPALYTCVENFSQQHRHYAPKFEETSQEETLHQERCARRAVWDLTKNIYKPKNSDKTTFCSPIEVRATPALTSKLPEERELVVDSRASMHMLSKRI